MNKHQFILLLLILFSLINPLTHAQQEEVVPQDVIPQEIEIIVQRCDVQELITAIEQANLQPTLITLPPNCNFTLFNVHNNTDGPNALPSIRGTIRINANGAIFTRDVNAPPFRILHISPGGDLTLNNAVITRGLITGETGRSGVDGTDGDDGAPGNRGTNGFNGGDGLPGITVRGGGILNSGTLLLINSTVIENVIQGGIGGNGGNAGNGGNGGDATSSTSVGGDGGAGGIGGDGGRGGNGQGGGIYNTGILILENCFVLNNTAQGGTGGLGGRGGDGGQGGAGIGEGDDRVSESSGGRGGDAVPAAREGTRSANPQAVSNSDGGDGQGGGIYNNGTLQILNTTFRGNRALGGQAQIGGAGGNGGLGGFGVNGGTPGEYGFGSIGGVGGDGGHGQGGALFNDGAMNLSRSTLNENETQGGIGSAAGNGGTALGALNEGDDVVEAHGRGGAGGYGGNSEGSALYNSGTMRVNNATVSGNFGDGGNGGRGGIGGNNLTELTGIGGDAGNAFGGGIFTDGSVAIVINATIFGNGGNPGNPALGGNEGIADGGGVYGQIELGNTIIANSLFSNCGGPVGAVSLGHNIATDNSCNLVSSGDLASIDPLLVPLQNNGGPSLTHALADSSPAIDAGSNELCFVEPVNDIDQRGLVRRMDGDQDGQYNCDIGAFEFIGPPPFEEVPIIATPTPFLLRRDIDIKIEVLLNTPSGEVAQALRAFGPVDQRAIRYRITATNERDTEITFPTIRADFDERITNVRVLNLSEGESRIEDQTAFIEGFTLDSGTSFSADLEASLAEDIGVGDILLASASLDSVALNAPVTTAVDLVLVPSLLPGAASPWWRDLLLIGGAALVMFAMLIIGIRTLNTRKAKFFSQES